jgi:acyl-CoA hydrolase
MGPQLFQMQMLTELTTIAAAASTLTAITIPANAIVFGVSVRVIVAIPTATTFTVTGNSSATVFNTASVSTVVNSTDPGTKSCPLFNATAQAIKITPSSAPATNVGRVRVTIYYYIITPPTS